MEGEPGVDGATARPPRARGARRGPGGGVDSGGPRRGAGGGPARDADRTGRVGPRGRGVRRAAAEPIDRPLRRDHHPDGDPGAGAASLAAGPRPPRAGLRVPGPGLLRHRPAGEGLGELPPAHPAQTRTRAVEGDGLAQDRGSLRRGEEGPRRLPRRVLAPGGGARHARRDGWEPEGTRPDRLLPPRGAGRGVHGRGRTRGVPDREPGGQHRAAGDGVAAVRARAHTRERLLPHRAGGGRDLGRPRPAGHQRPRPPPAPPPPPGDPPGARIFKKGEARGVTPAQIDAICSGKVRVEVKHAAGKYIKDLVLGKDEATSLDCPIRPPLAFLAVEGASPAAQGSRTDAEERIHQNLSRLTSLNFITAPREAVDRIFEQEKLTRAGLLPGQGADPDVMRRVTNRLAAALEVQGFLIGVLQEERLQQKARLYVLAAGSTSAEPADVVFNESASYAPLLDHL